MRCENCGKETATLYSDATTPSWSAAAECLACMTIKLEKKYAKPMKKCDICGKENVSMIMRDGKWHCTPCYGFIFDSPKTYWLEIIPSVEYKVHLTKPALFVTGHEYKEVRAVC